MTAEDRAAHVEREAVARVLAAHRQEHDPSTGGSNCECGEWSGPFTMHTGAGAYAYHLADVVLAALPQTGDAADDRLICCPECRSVFEAEDHTIHDGDEMAALARVFALADEWEAAGTVSVYESAGELGQILRAALTAGADL